MQPLPFSCMFLRWIGPLLEYMVRESQRLDLPQLRCNLLQVVLLAFLAESSQVSLLQVMLVESFLHPKIQHH